MAIAHPISTTQNTIQINLTKYTTFAQMNSIFNNYQLLLTQKDDLTLNTLTLNRGLTADSLSLSYSNSQMTFLNEELVYLYNNVLVNPNQIYSSLKIGVAQEPQW